MSAIAVQPEMWPLMGVREATKNEANDLLVKWEHPLGPCNRPFGQRCYVFELGDAPVATATSASTVSSTSAGMPRRQIVELARIARHPDHPLILRVMLRLWRVYLAQTWPYWPVSAAVSYAMPGTPGDLYRFDGWERVGPVKRSGGGGTWTSTDPKVARIADGVKTLWIYRYETEEAES